MVLSLSSGKPGRVAPNKIPQGAKSTTLISITQKLSTQSLRHVLKTLRLKSTHHLAALVVDLFGTAAFDVADEVGVPPYILYTGNFLALSVDLHLSTLDAESSVPVKMPGCRPIPREDPVKAGGSRQDEPGLCMASAPCRFLHKSEGHSRK
ncbi:hydroquinone glucosyltransferase [Cinnamomum micranthum f. kanehirae]|uniref:Hydroquinone glucosyltransferase n=1 Tax=Cinnamomum micranthum f. kanehirae TaxID=337451 RepID=A0A3S3N0D0_9MAGN|nr:hydroquinone glucosyltransferase [Cinnamomum micranthum f. kanehirae]